jgi:hypothetical protein
LTFPEQIAAHDAKEAETRRWRAVGEPKKKLKTLSRMYSLSHSSAGISSRRPFVKLSRPFLAIAVMTASAVSAGSAFAGGGCPDDPERCVERGATVSHRTVAVAPTTVATTTPAHAVPVATQARKATAAPLPARKTASKPARLSPAMPAPATPGMGMLLKLSNGSGGEVSLFPSKTNENPTGASWVL